MKVAIYCRMSSDQQEGSIAQQEVALRKLAEQKGYQIVGSYHDEGISGQGSKTAARQGLQRLIADAVAGKFRRILCWDQDRFSRADMLEIGEIVAPLRRARVSLETIAQGVIDWNSDAAQITFGVIQQGKARYLADLSRGTLRGNVAKQQSLDGYPGGPAPYGYRRITELQRQRRISRLEIVEEHAAIVRRIFREYAQPGASANLIADRLTREGIPSPRGAKVWRRENVARLLGCRVYLGYVTWGKENRGAFTVRTIGGLVSRSDYEAAADDGRQMELQGAFVHHRPDLAPPIIDEALFELVQSRLKERQKATRSQRRTHPLSGLVRCSVCSRTMHASAGHTKGRPCYRCSSHRYATGKACSGQRIAEPLLLDAIAGMLTEAFAPPRAVSLLEKRIAALAAEPKSKPGKPTAALERRLAALERRLSDGMARLTLVPAGLVAELGRALEGIRSERDEAARLLAEARAEATSGAVDPRQIVSRAMAIYRDLAKALRSGNPVLVNAGLRELGCDIVIAKPKAGPIEAEISLLAIRPEAGLACIERGRVRSRRRCSRRARGP